MLKQQQKNYTCPIVDIQIYWTWPRGLGKKFMRKTFLFFDLQKKNHAKGI